MKIVNLSGFVKNKLLTHISKIYELYLTVLSTQVLQTDQTEIETWYFLITNMLYDYTTCLRISNVILCNTIIILLFSCLIVAISIFDVSLHKTTNKVIVIYYISLGIVYTILIPYYWDCRATYYVVIINKIINNKTR